MELHFPPPEYWLDLITCLQRVMHEKGKMAPFSRENWQSPLFNTIFPRKSLKKKVIVTLLLKSFPWFLYVLTIQF